MTLPTTPHPREPRPATSKVPFPPDYLERVYAGVLGKMIGVYLGRPFEMWSHERILSELGEIHGYVHERLNLPLIVADDDLSGTFTFLRSLEDHGFSPDLTPEQIGHTWLNYLIEKRTVLWWGGLGMSTEHTAYLRLKAGIPAPQSGSIALNGSRVAEQIGAQIFIDGWAMISPGNPAQAADFARRAGSVSHDGEAIYAAQLIAALEAQAFVESDLNRLIDCALEYIPADSQVARLIADIRDLHRNIPDWREARATVAGRYGQAQFGGNCHVIPNIALIVLALLYGEGDFDRSMTIINTSGFDTDCNAGNLGCLLGIRGGLATLEGAYDWRGPVADRLYLSTADSGRTISDAVQESVKVVDAARQMRGLEPLELGGGARFHFELPGSVQGFLTEGGSKLRLENVLGHSAQGQRSLMLEYGAGTARAYTATFSPLEALRMDGKTPYDILASPTLYPGQTVTAALEADTHNALEVRVRLYLRHFDNQDALSRVYGPEVALRPGALETLTWRVPDLGGQPCAEIGLELVSSAPGRIYLDTLGWSGTPTLMLARPQGGGTLWRRAWVNGVDDLEMVDRWPNAYTLIQNAGTGLMIQGAREWRDYRAKATVSPHLCVSSGLAVRVQGMRRYYALVLCKGGKLQLVKALEGQKVLAEMDFGWDLDAEYTLELEVHGKRLKAYVDGMLLLEAEDGDRPLEGGAVALIIEKGMLTCDAVEVRP